MSGCPQWTFPEVSPEIFARIKDKVQSSGAPVSQPTTAETGTFTYEGCQFAWSYDSAAQVLYVTCQKLSFLAKETVGCDGVYEKLNGLLTQARNGAV